MAVISKQRLLRSSAAARPWWGWIFVIIAPLIAYRLGQQSGWWWLALILIAAIHLRRFGFSDGAKIGGKVAAFWSLLPGLVVGLSATLIIASVPRQATQVAVAVLYGAWLVWRELEPPKAPTKLVQLLLVQAVMFEAIFLMAAIWPIPSPVILIMVWAGSYFTVYAALIQRGDKSAGVIAATWGVIAAEVSWILLMWLITYTMHGGYVLVPQPALILTALAYIFGSILSSSRQGNLSRGRLGEYMVIGLVLVMIVVLGTSWRGNV